MLIFRDDPCSMSEAADLLCLPSTNTKPYQHMLVFKSQITGLALKVFLTGLALKVSITGLALKVFITGLSKGFHYWPI